MQLSLGDSVVVGRRRQNSSHAPREEARERLVHLASFRTARDSVDAFLAELGVSPSVRAAAARRAQAEAIALALAYLIEAPDGEERFYRGLARRLGLRFVESVPGLMICNFEEDLRAGAVPVRAAGRSRACLIAPAPERVGALLAARGGALPRDRVFLTSPRRLRALMLEHGEAEADRLANGALRRFEPRLTAQTAPGRLLLCLTGAALGVFALACKSSWLWLAAWIAFGGGTFLRLFAGAASCARPRSAPLPLADADLPVYTILAPLYREARILPQLLEAFEALDYPRSRLDVKLIVEKDDAATRAELTARPLPSWIEIVVAPQGEPRTKPRALNFGLLLARGSLLVVYDAEDAPDPPQLREAAARFAAAGPDLACLQAALAIHNVKDSPLATLFGLEYAALFDVLLPGLAACALPLPLGGTSNHFRVAALRRLYGWDAWNVTEDIDLGLRLARFGYRVDVLDSTTQEEAPARRPAWLRQRRRWLKGWMVTLLTHGRTPWRTLRELGLVRFLGALHLTASPLAGFLIGPIVVVRLGIAIARGQIPMTHGVAAWLGNSSIGFLSIAGLAAILWPALLGARRRGRLGLAHRLILLPAYFLLLFCAAWWALWDLWREPFFWAKTEHGLVRAPKPDAEKRSKKAAGAEAISIRLQKNQARPRLPG